MKEIEKETLWSNLLLSPLRSLTQFSLNNATLSNNDYICTVGSNDFDTWTSRETFARFAITFIKSLIEKNIPVLLFEIFIFLYNKN